MDGGKKSRTRYPQYAAITDSEIVEGIMRVREGRLQIEPGYDGEYGKVKIFEEGERRSASPQTALF